MRISDWSSDVCSSDLAAVPDEILLDPAIAQPAPLGVAGEHAIGEVSVDDLGYRGGLARFGEARGGVDRGWHGLAVLEHELRRTAILDPPATRQQDPRRAAPPRVRPRTDAGAQRILPN